MTNPTDREFLVACLQHEWGRFSRPTPPPATVIDAHVGTDADGDPVFQVVYRPLASSEVLGAQIPIVDDPNQLSRFFEQILFELFDEPNDTNAGFQHGGVWWWKPRDLRSEELLTGDETRVSLPGPTP